MDFVNLHCIDLVDRMLFGPQYEKTCLQGLRPTLAQISLCIHTVLSGPLLSLTESTISKLAIREISIF